MLSALSKLARITAFAAIALLLPNFLWVELEKNPMEVMAQGGLYTLIGSSPEPLPNCSPSMNQSQRQALIWDTTIQSFKTCTSSPAGWSVLGGGPSGNCTVNEASLITTPGCDMKTSTGATGIIFQNPSGILVQAYLANSAGGGSAVVLANILGSPLVGDTLAFNSSGILAETTFGIPSVAITTASYPIASTQRGYQLLCQSGCTGFTIPPAGSTGFLSSFDVTIINQTASQIPFTPTTSTVSGGSTSVTNAATAYINGYDQCLVTTLSVSGNGSYLLTCVSTASNGQALTPSSINVNSDFTVNSSGVPTTISGAATAGLGVPINKAIVTSTNLSYTAFNSATPVTLLASSSTAGHYRIEASQTNSTTFTGCSTIGLSFQWTDQVQAQNTGIQAQSGLTSGVWGNPGGFSFWSTGTAAITYTPLKTGSACTAGAAYIVITLLRLQ